MQSNNTVKVGDRFTSSESSYEVHSLLGSGSSGQVALCHKASTNQMVALKVLTDPHSGSAAQREARVLQVLQVKGARSHHIVQWMDSFECRGQHCHELEKLDIDLMSFLSTCPDQSLPLKHIRPVVTQIARALQLLKSVQIIHGDVKPCNVMLINRYEQPFGVKLIDFGFACRVREAERGAAMQTFYYRAPEVQVGAHINQAIDVWSLGCMAAEMLLGGFLFDAHDPFDLMRHVVQIVGQPPNQVLDSGILTWLHFQKRYQSTDWVYTWKPRPQSNPFSVSSLDEIYDRYPFNGQQTTSKAEKSDCRLFVDLLKHMLDPDPASRFTPEDILNHPFITMTHLSSHCPFYYSQCHQIMEQAMTVSDEEQESSSTASTEMSEEEDTTVATEGQKPSQKRSREEEEEAPRKRLRKEDDTFRNSQTEDEATKKSWKDSRRDKSSSSQHYSKKKRAPRKQRQSNEQQSSSRSYVPMLKAADITVVKQSQTSSQKRSREEEEEAPRKRLRKEDDMSRNRQTDDEATKKRPKEAHTAVQSRQKSSSSQQYRKEKGAPGQKRRSNDDEEEQHSSSTSSTQTWKAADATVATQAQKPSQKRKREDKEKGPQKRLRKEDDPCWNAAL